MSEWVKLLVAFLVGMFVGPHIMGALAARKQAAAA